VQAQRDSDAADEQAAHPGLDAHQKENRMSKGGLHVLTRNLALEFASHQMRVSAVAPAVVATPIYERFVP
jgi:NAD(P)-dependent dehydrogenase (short-subunit alcohol dehydrogenase family)